MPTDDEYSDVEATEEEATEEEFSDEGQNSDADEPEEDLYIAATLPFWIWANNEKIETPPMTEIIIDDTKEPPNKKPKFSS